MQILEEISRYPNMEEAVRLTFQESTLNVLYTALKVTFGLILECWIFCSLER